MTMYRKHRADNNQDAIVQAFEKFGCAVQRIGRPLDLLVSVPGVTWLVDCKAKNGKLTPAQQKFCAKWLGTWSIVRDMNGVQMVVRKMRQRQVDERNR